MTRWGKDCSSRRCTESKRTGIFPDEETEPSSSAVKTWSPNHWMVRIPLNPLNPFKLKIPLNSLKSFLIKNFPRLVQDVRVEGHALTPSCESTWITTNCWTIIDRKTLELTKKDTSHLKTKEKPQWDSRRGTITIKSNPITAGWVTHTLENTYTTEVHSLEWRFWATCQASQPGGLAMGGGIHRESEFDG